jgi:hypothetical protein
MITFDLDAIIDKMMNSIKEDIADMIDTAQIEEEAVYQAAKSKKMIALMQIAADRISREATMKLTEAILDRLDDIASNDPFHDLDIIDII